MKRVLTVAGVQYRLPRGSRAAAAVSKTGIEHAQVREYERRQHGKSKCDV